MMELVELGSENDARMARLREALRLGSGFQLMIVQVEPGIQRDEVLRRLLAWSGEDGVPALTVIRLARGDSPLARLAGDHAGVILVGLEASRDAAESRAMVVGLNWGRNRLPDLVHGPLILVVSQRIQTTLFEQAPDLYSWRTSSTSIAPQSPWPRASTVSYDVDLDERPDVLEARISEAAKLTPVPLRELSYLYGQLSLARTIRGESSAAEAAFDVAYDYAKRGGTTDDRIALFLMRSTFIESWRGRHEDANDWLDRAFAEAAAGTVSAEMSARLLVESVIVSMNSGDLETASRELPAALAALEALGHHGAHEAKLTMTAAMIAVSRGELDEAEVLMADSCARYRRAGHTLGEASALMRLANLLARRGRSEDAERYAADALARAEVSRSSNMIAEARAALGRIALTNGNVELATSVLGGEVAPVNPESAALLAEARGELALHHGRLAEASGQFRRAIEDHERRGGSTPAATAIMLQLGEVGRRMKDWPLARSSFAAALESGSPRQRAIAGFGLADVDFEQGERTAALGERLQAARSLLHAAGEPARADEARRKHAEVLVALGQVSEARKELEVLHDDARARGHLQVATEIRARLEELGHSPSAS